MILSVPKSTGSVCMCQGSGMDTVSWIGMDTWFWYSNIHLTLTHTPHSLLRASNIIFWQDKNLYLSSFLCSEPQNELNLPDFSTWISEKHLKPNVSISSWQIQEKISQKEMVVDFWRSNQNKVKSFYHFAQAILLTHFLINKLFSKCSVVHL